uniref:Uncharacterized protein n=1 Tax=Romanomermis culicivorax TaxID=13658 RepID=A0A915K5E0_ROMCU
MHSRPTQTPRLQNEKVRQQNRYSGHMHVEKMLCVKNVIAHCRRLNSRNQRHRRLSPTVADSRRQESWDFFSSELDFLQIAYSCLRIADGQRISRIVEDCRRQKSWDFSLLNRAL